MYTDALNAIPQGAMQEVLDQIEALERISDESGSVLCASAIELLSGARRSQAPEAGTPQRITPATH